jgi:hypothetical protein
MALLADFGPPSSTAAPEAVRLTLRELRTLVHELGHCCHNLLSRTKYQHLWGTRCDVVAFHPSECVFVRAWLGGWVGVGVWVVGWLGGCGCGCGCTCSYS